MVHKDQLVYRDLKEIPVRKVIAESRASRVSADRRVFKVNKESKESRGRKVSKVSAVPKESRENADSKATQVSKAQRAIKEIHIYLRQKTSRRSQMRHGACLR